MARSINVYRLTDVEFFRPGGVQLSADAEPLYDDPFGSEEDVRELRSTPAAELGLPFLAEIFPAGTRGGTAWQGEQLHQVEAELTQLEASWAELELDADRLAIWNEQTANLRAGLLPACDQDALLLIN